MVALEKSLIEAFNASEKKEISFKSVRNASMQRFKQEGFPTIQNEEWKYTNWPIWSASVYIIRERLVFP